MKCSAQTPLRCGVLILASMGVALVANALSPRGIALTPSPPDQAPPTDTPDQAADEDLGFETVTLDQAKVLLEQGEHLILDARSRGSYTRGRLPGALSVPYKDGSADLSQVQVFFAPDQPVLIYCSGAACRDSHGLAELLKDQPVGAIRVMNDGFAGWRAAGLPVEEGE